jgi:DNA (cytosine-5)-methyltransferase 1
MTLTVGSLFSGIGGIDLGLELAGMKVRWQVEIDPWCQRVLEKHWPNVDRYEDVREVGAHNLERVDVIAGGFPCQDISDAGKRQGIGGARSGLWADFARIIRELRPRYVFVENVAALRLRGLDVVLSDLSAIGYDAEWDCIPAAAVGAPHLRNRLWLVAYPSRHLRGASGDARPEPLDRRRADVPDANGGGLQERTQLDGEAEQASTNGHPRRQYSDRLRDALADSEGVGRGAWGPQGSAGVGEGLRQRPLPDADRESSIRSAIARTEHSHWAVEPNVGRVANGVPRRVDRLRGLGNAVVPQNVELIGRAIVEAEGRAMRTDGTAGLKDD